MVKLKLGLLDFKLTSRAPSLGNFMDRFVGNEEVMRELSTWMRYHTINVDDFQDCYGTWSYYETRNGSSEELGTCGSEKHFDCERGCAVYAFLLLLVTITRLDYYEWMGRFSFTLMGMQAGSWAALRIGMAIL